MNAIQPPIHPIPMLNVFLSLDDPSATKVATNPLANGIETNGSIQCLLDDSAKFQHI